MTDSHAPGALKEMAPDNSSTNDEGLAELRSLLLGPAESQLLELNERLSNPQKQAEDVSRVLPEAVLIRSRKDRKITEALLPTVEEAINISVKKEPKVLVDALFPVIGPMIRKAISAALSGMIQSFNQTLEYSFSLRGLRWRIEALRTGKSFAEIVLLHSLLYRVEQVFLIHRETGLMLQHVVAGSGAVQDADMVSGMLTAIQDFVHDSFSTGKEDRLETMQVGELTVWVEQGPQAILAGVIRGNAPQELRTVFRDALEQIHLEYGDALKDFDGDTTPFEACRPILENCLRSQYDASRQTEGGRRRVSPLLILLAVVIVALLLWLFFSLRSARRWEAYLEKLKSEPGIVVTSAREGYWKYYISGLRDPLAADPQKFLGEEKIDPADVVSRWQSYYALDAELVLARARALLNPPSTVKLRLENGVLYAEGSAPHGWIEETRRSVRFIPGLNGIDESKLTDSDQAELDSLKEQIEKEVIIFNLGTTQYVPGQNENLTRVLTNVERLSVLAQSVRKNVRLEIIGHTDTSGTERINGRLSPDRAEKVASDLAAKFGTLRGLTVVTRGSRDLLRDELTDEDRAFNRSDSFKVTLTDNP